ncbi:MAG: UbiA family prenyltransferase [Myxococcales bacterium]|nr:UbiA family prenyltransferase [Myxococcota bacterium]MDW8283526.1 UbiA family prenyltransferase [Myxococcales bacterium]
MLVSAARRQALATILSISRLHIVAIAALGTLTFGWLLTGRHPVLLSAVCALDWFLVNLLNRVVDLPEDRANAIAGTEFAARHARTLLAVGLGCLGGSLLAVHLIVPAITPVRVAYHALGLAYNWPLWPGGRRLKQLYFWKNTASALGFVLTVFGYPLAAAWGQPLAPGITWATVGCALGFFVLFELSYEIIYDLRDLPGDRAAGVRTYPVVHGMRGAVRIIDGLLVASSAVLLMGYGAGLVPWRLAIMMVAPALQALVYKRALRRGITSADCIRLTWLGASLLATYHLWVLLRLPGADL